MFTKEDILAMLREGTDPTKLAQDFADVLNESVAAYDQEKKDAAAELQKQIDWNTLVETFTDWAMKYIPDVYNHFEKEFNDLADAPVNDIINACNEALENTNRLMAAMFPKEEKKMPAAVSYTARVTDEDMDTILKWLEANKF